jgi:uncharacterized membrane protein (UPF0127 family)
MKRLKEAEPFLLFSAAIGQAVNQEGFWLLTNRLKFDIIWLEANGRIVASAGSLD